MSERPRFIGSAIHISDGANVHETCLVGHGSIIGYSTDSDDSSRPTLIERNCQVGCFCVIDAGVVLREGVIVDHYVRIGAGTQVGERTLLLYGTRIHLDVSIGRNCRISGNCPDRTIIEDDVTHFGRLHHDYLSPALDWEENEEPSTIIRRGAVIGANAVVVGAVQIGERAYIAAGEIVRQSVPPRSVMYKGKIIPASEWRGRLRHSGFFDYR